MTKALLTREYQRGLYLIEDDTVNWLLKLPTKCSSCGLPMVLFEQYYSMKEKPALKFMLQEYRFTSRCPDCYAKKEENKHAQKEVVEGNQQVHSHQG